MNISGQAPISIGKSQLEYKNLLSCKSEPAPGTAELQLGICLLLGLKHIKRLPEFITYHHLVGVERFFLYFHGTKDDLDKNWRYFKPFVQRGWVEIIPHHFETNDFKDGIQLGAYNDCLHTAKGVIKWIGILDLDEYFQIQPGSGFHSLVDLINSHEEYTSLSFRTFFYVYKGDVQKYVENCEYPSFINDWTLCKDEHKNRPDKAIHLAMANDYIGVHRHAGRKKAINISTSEGVLAHYRFPYKKYTLSGLKDGSYFESLNFKNTFGAQIIENLRTFGYDVKCDTQ